MFKRQTKTNKLPLMILQSRKYEIERKDSDLQEKKISVNRESEE